MTERLEHTWQWLVPPVVTDSQGQLLPRQRARPGAVAGTAKDTAADPMGDSCSVMGRRADTERPALAPPPPSPSSPPLQSERLANLALAMPAIAPDLFDDGVERSPLVVPPLTSELLRSEQEHSLPPHPQANQMLQINGQVVHYLLQRSQRKSVGFTIHAQGLVVTAPQWLGLEHVRAALVEKADWIVRKLRESGQRLARQQALQTEWRDGGQLDYLGRGMRLCLQTPGQPALHRAQALREEGPQQEPRLYLPLTLASSEAQVRAATQAWILRQARPHFSARLQHFAPQLGVRWTALRLTSARTRWGSANSEGVIRLNWRLMQHRPEVIDYVVVHELAHLRHMDHSAQFWRVVESVSPQWKPLRQELKEKPLPVWD